MQGYLRQSTASQSRLIGPFLDDTDFKTEETGLTIANTDIKLRANGTTLANKNSGGGTHQVNGCYSVTWDATDTANVGELFFSIKVAGALPVFGTYVVVEEAVYDAQYVAAAPGYVATQVVASVTGSVGSVTGSVGSVTGAVGSVTGNVGGNVTGSVGSVATDGITSNSLAASAITEIQTGLATSAALATVQADTDNIQTRLPAALVSGRMDASVGAYQTGLTPLQPTVAGRTLDVTATGGAGIDWANVESPTTSVGLTNTTISSSQAVASVTGAVGSVTGAVGSVTGAVGSVTGSVGSVAANGITATSLDPTASAEIADGVWDEAIAGHLTAGSTGAALNAAGSGASPAAIADAVWDEAIAGHLTAGSTGAALNAAGGAGDPWITPLPGAYTAGQAGFIVGTNLDATVSSRASAAQATAIQADTDDIQTRLPAALVGGRMDASVGAMAASSITAATIATGAIDADALATDAVNEIRDAIMAAPVEGAVTVAESLRLANTANGGKTNGMGTATANLRDLADTKNRVVATVDGDGNRSAVTLNLTP